MKLLIGYTHNNKRVQSPIAKNIKVGRKYIYIDKMKYPKSNLRVYDIVELDKSHEYFFIVSDIYQGIQHYRIKKSSPVNTTNEGIIVIYDYNLNLGLHTKKTTIKYDDIIAMSYEGKLNFDKLSKYGYKGNYIILDYDTFKQYSSKRPKISIKNIIIPRHVLQKTDKPHILKIYGNKLNDVNDNIIETISHTNYFYIFNKDKTKKYKFVAHGKSGSNHRFYSNKLKISIDIIF